MGKLRALSRRRRRRRRPFAGWADREGKRRCNGCASDGLGLRGDQGQTCASLACSTPYSNTVQHSTGDRQCRFPDPDKADAGFSR